VIKQPTNLPEYEDNPFTAALGPPRSWDDQFDVLEVKARHNEEERAWPHHLRRHAALRLFDLMIPTPRQVELVERFDMVIRQGYKSRHPRTGMHRQAFMKSAAALEAISKGMKPEDARKLLGPPIDSQAQGFALLGDPGMGKTRTVKRILAAFEDTVIPQLDYTVTQVPCLRVESPSRGGRKHFAELFFRALDEKLGTDYYDLHWKARASAEHLILTVQHLANLHALGVLVIDEIQHLAHSQEGVGPMMSFLVSLVNISGIPVVLVGTNTAREIIEHDFREARRAAGIPNRPWERMKEGSEEFNDFVEELWTYQWTNVHTPLTPEIKAAIFAESQGIIDIIVKLFLIAQMRAITAGEVSDNPGAPELLSADLFHQVAADELGVIAPMIRAMRDGRVDELVKYPDLQPFHDRVDAIIGSKLGMPMAEFRRLRQLRERTLALESEAKSAPWAPLKASLESRGIPGLVADGIIAKALDRVPSGDALEMSQVVGDLLLTELAAGNVTPRKTPARSRKGGSVPKPGSLAAIVAGSDDPHASLVQNGLIKPLSKVLSKGARLPS